MVGKVLAMETVVVRSIPELSKFGQFGTRVSLYISHHVIVKEDVMDRARVVPSHDTNFKLDKFTMGLKI